MAIVLPLPVVNNQAPWRRRLDGAAFRQPPWHDRHPDRTACVADLPTDLRRLADLFDRLVDRLDLAALVGSYAHRGDRPHRPDLLLKAVLFLTHRGKHSPADWCFQAQTKRLVQWLLRGLRPSRARWYAFRDRLGPFVADLNRQLLRQAHDLGLLTVQVPVLDGSLLAANSSRHKLVNQPTLQRRLLQLQQAMAADAEPAVDREPVPADAGPTPDPAALAAEPTTAAGSAEPLPAAVLDVCAAAAVPGPAALAQLPTAVAPGLVEPAPPLPLPVPVHPAGGGQGPYPAWLAQTPGGRLQQHERYLEADRQLQQRLAHNARRRKEDRKPPEQVRLSLGDPEATLGLDKERVYRPLYNVQVAVDLDSAFYLGYGAFRGVQDGSTLLPMLRRLQYFVPWAERRWLLTDAGYAWGSNLRALEQERVSLVAPWQENDWTAAKKGPVQLPKREFRWDSQQQVYVCPEGKILKYVRQQTKRRGEVVEQHQQYRCAAAHCLGCPRQEQCTSKPEKGRMVVGNEYEEELERLRQRMQTPQAQALYRQRKEQAERGFADSKQHRQLRRLSMRGQQGAELQLGLVVLAHNLVTLGKLTEAAHDQKISSITPLK